MGIVPQIDRCHMAFLRSDFWVRRSERRGGWDRQRPRCRLALGRFVSKRKGLFNKADGPKTIKKERKKHLYGKNLERYRIKNERSSRQDIYLFF